MPISWACLSDCSKLRPCSMPLRIVLVVELRIPRKLRRWMAGRVSKREKMGAPSITVDSKRKRRCFGCGEGTEFLVSVDHGAFVRCDSVRAHFQRSADVIDGGLAGGDV